MIPPENTNNVRMNARKYFLILVLRSKSPMQKAEKRWFILFLVGFEYWTLFDNIYIGLLIIILNDIGRGFNSCHEVYCVTFDDEYGFRRRTVISFSQHQK